MGWPSHLNEVKVPRQGRRTLFIGRAAGVVLLLLVGLPAFAARVPVRDGQSVTLKLRNLRVNLEK